MLGEGLGIGSICCRQGGGQLLDSNSARMSIFQDVIWCFQPSHNTQGPRQGWRGSVGVGIYGTDFNKVLGLTKGLSQLVKLESREGFGLVYTHIVLGFGCIRRVRHMEGKREEEEEEMY